MGRRVLPAVLLGLAAGLLAGTPAYATGEPRPGTFGCAALGAMAGASTPEGTGTGGMVAYTGCWEPSDDPVSTVLNATNTAPPVLVLGGATVSIGAVRSTTSAPPAYDATVGDQATARAALTTVHVTAPGVDVRFSTIDAHAEATCVALAAPPALTSGGGVSDLVVNGRAYGTVTEPTTITLGAGVLKLNQQDSGESHGLYYRGGYVHRRAFDLTHPNGRLIIADVVTSYEKAPCGYWAPDYGV
jgi:hypothetical protein